MCMYDTFRPTTGSLSTEAQAMGCIPRLSGFVWLYYWSPRYEHDECTHRLRQVRPDYVNSHRGSTSLIWRHCCTLHASLLAGPVFRAYVAGTSEREM